MRAAVRERYGTPDAIQVKDVEVPVPKDDQVLVEVHSSSLNKTDMYNLKAPVSIRIIGRSGIRRPKDVRLGTDLSGVVKSVGTSVKRFKPGDEVFGIAAGSYAEFAVAREHRLSLKPPGVSFEDAGSVPVAAVTALQGLKKGMIRGGQNVLVVGASGGVGNFAVQIAKSYGAQVTASCSPRNLENAKRMGADSVIDYTTEDFTGNAGAYDLILGVNGYHSILSFRRALAPKGAYLMVGSNRPIVSILETFIVGRLVSRSNGKHLGFMGVADVTPDDLDAVSSLLQSGKMRPLIDARYPLEKTADAFRYFAEGHTHGKVVVTVRAQ